MAEKKIGSTRRLTGSIHVPGDKSISHRALLLAAIAEGDSEIHGLSAAQDVASTRKCLQDLGISIESKSGLVRVQGQGKYGLSAPLHGLDAGNSGTTIRLLTGILAAQKFTSVIDGDASLRARPMGRIIEPLGRMGAIISAQGNKAPLTIQGTRLKALQYDSPIASAQVKSCILLAGLYASGLTIVKEPTLSRDHTERMLKEFGVCVTCAVAGIGINGPVKLKGSRIHVPGDISAAAFFLIAGSLVPNSEIEICAVGVNPTRTGIASALTEMGGDLQIKNQITLNNEPRADLLVRSRQLQAIAIGGAMIPKIIDEIPILAVAATQASGTTLIRDAKELRVKETDRIHSLVTNLQRMGAQVEEFDDGLAVTGPTPLHGAILDSFHDHRIAMAFAVAALIAEGETVIQNSECVDISFPGFYELLASIRNDG